MLSDLLLGGDGEFIAGDEAAHLLQSEAQELLPLHHLCEVLLWETQTRSVTHNATKHCNQQDEQVAGFQRFQLFFFFSPRLVKVLHKNHHHLPHHTTQTHSGKYESGSGVWTVRSLPAYAWAWLRSCVHVCRSAKALMPRQLVGWSWDCRNSQQTWRTSISWRRLAAGRRTWRDDTQSQSKLQLDLFCILGFSYMFKSARSVNIKC